MAIELKNTIHIPMQHLLMLSLWLLFGWSLPAQNDMGTIRFERREFRTKIEAQLPWMTQEEIDRRKLTRGNRDGQWTEKYTLSFNPESSLYEKMESEEPGNWRRPGQDETFLLYRDYDQGLQKDLRSLLQKEYKVEGELPRFKWKILNEIKEIRGFLCMKADTYDPFKGVPVIAWFTDQIPVKGGPEGYWGLPGMILGLDIGNGCVMIDAMDIKLNQEVAFKFPEKNKAKGISPEDFILETKEAIQKSMESKRNPYWFIRY